MIKKYLIVILLGFTSSIAGMLVFYHFFNPVKKIYIEQEQRAKLTADREIIWSDRLVNNLRSANPTNFIKAANDGRDAVVYIRSLKPISDNSYSNTYSAGTGSGVIISADGYIVTNHHVIENATDVEVILNNNMEFNAKIVGKDPGSDLALLKIKKEGLSFLPFGNSDSLSIGEWVMAIGNPYKLQSTVTAGIVSAKARNINILDNSGIESFIQTDAAVNPGNSGGALINTIGELVGINAAIMSRTGRFEGFSFAIPSNLVRKIVHDLKQYGTVQRGWMGITINDVTSEIAKELNLPTVTGVYMAGVRPDGSAAFAGLKRGDVIVEVEGKSTPNMPTFMEIIAQYRPGDVLNIIFIRESNKQTTKVTLHNNLNSTEMVEIRKDEVLSKLGIEIRDLSQAEKNQHKNGVYVISIKVNSAIADTNMDPGFIITKINDKEVTDADMLIKYLQENKGEILIEGYYEKYPGEYPYRFFNK